MNNKLFTNISIQEQENTSGGANFPAPAIDNFLDVIPILVNNSLPEILPSFVYDLPILGFFGF
ncbi:MULTISPECIES: hypothetical protein [unclassified Anabaena]|uniref:hypothetical protein n=1 Tax=unclassified Anabaena TaxID=2619674 RepID=UPI0014453D26|nr:MULTISPECIES: hypothetical protein [unclassified Anabaena]MTJ09209.1 hypothetical protein [Anabaena sp. UHCC 0204]MTJ53994.1 hypothetical protein [Anabaena sp. UHCC 0253]